jgi:DegV family protein with EDD domain
MYKVVADSSNEIDEAFVKAYPVDIVPFKLYIDGIEYVDDATLDVDAFVEKMVNSKNTPKTACPSPNEFLEHIKGLAEEVYMVTISSKLSGTYNSAILAKKLYEDEHSKDKFIHIFDSRGAAASETLVTKKIHDLKKMNLAPEVLVEKVEHYIKEMQVYFISESLENLIKNGRISKWKGLLASTLKIMPIMGANESGEIVLYEKVRNTNKAYQRLIDMVHDEIIESGKKIVAITHVGNYERAQQIKDELSKIKDIEEIINIKCAGLSSLYADKKGVIVAF